jgi:hypothetical protein
MKIFLFPRFWLPALTLAAFFADSSAFSVIPDAGPPLPVPALPEIPPLEIPEEHMPGIVLRKLAFDREFDSPVMLASLPDASGEQVIAMQRGEFCAVRLDGSGQWRPFLDFRAKMKGILLFEEGVHGIAFHPRFAENRLFYLSYTQNCRKRSAFSWKFHNHWPTTGVATSFSVRMAASTLRLATAVFVMTPIVWRRTPGCCTAKSCASM